MVNIQGYELNFDQLLGQSGNAIAIGAFIIFFLIFLGIIGFIIVYYTSFKYKAWEIVLSGSVTDGKKRNLAITKIRRNGFKWNRKKTAWVSMFPLFNRKEHKPIGEEFIYGNKNVLVYKAGNEYLPADVQFLDEEGLLQIKPVEPQLKEWQMMERRKNAIEFAETGFWAENKVFFMTLITVIACSALSLLVIWLSFRYATGKGVEISQLIEAIKNIGVIQGVAPS